MAQDTPQKTANQETANPDPHTETANAERQERDSKLLLRRPELTADEAARLRVYFPTIRARYHKLVWDILRKARVATHDIEELHQEVFFAS